MRRAFVEIEGRQIHFRYEGAGPPIILLHPSPNSSKMMIPLAKLLSEDFTVIAPDTPGYGLSDAFFEELDSLYDYVPVFRQFFKTLGLEKFALYGTATGAQLAIAYAISHPEDISHLFLDNAAHFKDEQRDAIVSNYFPDFTPHQDGSHLNKIWYLIRQMFLFFPWCDPKSENRLTMNFPPASVLNMVAMDFLQAGANYHLAYRGAFFHEKAENVQKLKVPSSIFYWEGSILKSYIQQLIDHELPDWVRVINIPADPAKRYANMARYIKGILGKQPRVLLRLSDKLPKKGQLFIPYKKGEIHAMIDLSKTGKPTLVLHEQAGSAKSLSALLSDQHLNGPSCFVSLPGHGDTSLKPLSAGGDSIALLLLHVLRFLNWEVCSILGMAWGDQLAQKIAQRFPKQFEYKAFPLDQDLFALKDIELTPDEYGTHLFKAWGVLQDRLLFRKHKKKTIKNSRKDNPQLSAEQLQLQLLDWLKYLQQ